MRARLLPRLTMCWGTLSGWKRGGRGIAATVQEARQRRKGGGCLFRWLAPKVPATYLTPFLAVRSSLPRASACRRLLDRRRGLWRGPHDAGELAALQELAAFPAAAGDLVLHGADRLLGAARGFHRQQVAVAGGRDEAQDAVLFRVHLDQDDAAARS